MLRTLLLRFVAFIVVIHFVPASVAVDVQLFRPVSYGGGLFSVHGTSTSEPMDLRNPFSWDYGAYYNLNYKPIEFGNANQASLDEVINTLHTFNLGLLYQFDDHWSFYVDYPLHYLGSFEATQSDTTKSSLASGDLLLAASYVIKRKRFYEYGLSVHPQIFLPTGSPGSLIGNSSLKIGAQLVADLAFGDKHYFAANLGYHYHRAEEFFNLKTGSAVRYAAGYSYSVRAKNDLKVIAEYVGNTAFANANTDVFNSPSELLLGVRKYTESGFQIDAGLGRGLNTGVGSPAFRLFAGVTFRKREERSIPPVETVETSKKELVEPDEDIEKIVKKLDTPIQIKIDKIFFDVGKTTIKSESLTVLDQLVFNLLENPKIRKVRVEGYTDNQGDFEKNMKLSQGRAQAVVEYLVKNGVVKDRLVSQGFGSENPIDTNETAKGRSNNRRVEFKIIEVSGNFEIDYQQSQAAVANIGDQKNINEGSKLNVGQLLQVGRVEFAKYKTELLIESHEILNQLRDFLVGHPEILLLRIEGYTDSRGNDEKNQELSEKRAESVMKYLIDAGIDPVRLQFQGRGERDPIESNDTAEGRAANRRVEYRVMNVSPGQN